ncbi:MAG: GxxExxY protein [Candidatus Binatia bacterium]
MDINVVSGVVVDASMRVHSRLGPGLLESTYEACLAFELRKRGLRVLTQLALPVTYDDLEIELGYRIDMLVEGCVIVELKALANILPVHRAQVLSYLRLSGRKVGLLINFNVPHLKDGITRVINDL